MRDYAELLTRLNECAIVCVAPDGRLVASITKKAEFYKEFETAIRALISERDAAVAAVAAERESCAQLAGSCIQRGVAPDFEDSPAAHFAWCEACAVIAKWIRERGQHG